MIRFSSSVPLVTSPDAPAAPAVGSVAPPDQRWTLNGAVVGAGARLAQVSPCPPPPGVWYPRGSFQAQEAPTQGGAPLPVHLPTGLSFPAPPGAMPGAAAAAAGTTLFPLHPTQPSAPTRLATQAPPVPFHLGDEPPPPPPPPADPDSPSPAPPTPTVSLQGAGDVSTWPPMPQNTPCSEKAATGRAPSPGAREVAPPPTIIETTAREVPAALPSTPTPGAAGVRKVVKNAVAAAAPSAPPSQRAAPDVLSPVPAAPLHNTRPPSTAAVARPKSVSRCDSPPPQRTTVPHAAALLPTREALAFVEVKGHESLRELSMGVPGTRRASGEAALAPQTLLEVMAVGPASSPARPRRSSRASMPDPVVAALARKSPTAAAPGRCEVCAEKDQMILALQARIRQLEAAAPSSPRPTSVPPPPILREQTPPPSAVKVRAPRTPPAAHERPPSLEEPRWEDSVTDMLDTQTNMLRALSSRNHLGRKLEARRRHTPTKSRPRSRPPRGNASPPKLPFATLEDGPRARNASPATPERRAAAAERPPRARRVADRLG
eukprot:TRINITY_DN2411_c0_g1_i2.p1 TRINITY_DN2411_c0_g1~~TRINITY_DN2411_c0_g1_i2.p1  ORF type:complete len:547 (+),score=110.41 TRINITY_DN2411_c0_g1_i2:110-1750(+)